MIWAQIAAEMNKLQEEVTRQGYQVGQVASLQAKELAEIMEEEMAHQEQEMKALS